MDVGSTTTDIVPIREGRLACEGRTDLARLTAGELVYTGVLRTNPNTLTATVPVRGRPCRVAAEHFAVMADAYVLLGRLSAADYTCSTPDGRDTSPAACAERLARLVCGDREMLSEAEIDQDRALPGRTPAAGRERGAPAGVSRWDGPAAAAVAPAGVGAFLAAEVAGRLGLARAPRGKHLGGRGRGAAGRRRRPPAGREPGGSRLVIDAVIKVGGSLGRGAVPAAAGRASRRAWPRLMVCWWCRAAAPSPTW